MSANKSFAPIRKDNPALFTYDFDGVFTTTNSHSDVMLAAQEKSTEKHGDTSQWRDYATVAVEAYIAENLIANPKGFLRQYDNLVETLRMHGENGDNLTIVTNNEFPEIVAATLNTLAKIDGLEYLKDIPVVYGGIFKTARADIPYSKEDGFFRISYNNAHFKNTHINTAMQVTGFDSYDQVCFIDDSEHNYAQASMLTERVHAVLRKKDTSNFHEQIREEIDLLKLPEAERYPSIESISGGYPSQEDLDFKEESGLSDEDFEGFSKEEAEIFAPVQKKLASYSSSYSSDVSDSDISEDEIGFSPFEEEHAVPVAVVIPGDRPQEPKPIAISQAGGNVAKAKDYWQKMMEYQKAQQEIDSKHNSLV